MLELLKRIFLVPDEEEKAALEGERQLSAHRYTTSNCEEDKVCCDYCGNPIPPEKYAKHRETCVTETGGFGHRHDHNH